MIKAGVVVNWIVIAILLANANLLWWRSSKPRSRLDTWGAVLTFLLLVPVVVFPTEFEAIFLLVLQVQLATYVGRRFGWRRPRRAMINETVEPRTRLESLRLLLLVMGLAVAVLCLFGTPGFGWITEALQALAGSKAFDSIVSCLFFLYVFVGWPVTIVADYIESRFWLRVVWVFVAMAVAAGCLVIEVRL